MKKTNWWLLLLQGLVAVVFGILVILWPIKSLVAITWLIGAFLLIESVIQIFYSFFNREHFGLLFLSGIISLIFSFILLGYPDMTLKILYFFFALWCIAFGISSIVGSQPDKDDPEKSQISVFGGVFTLIVGVLLLVFPIFTVAVSQIIFGFTMIVSGFGSVVLAFKSR